MKGILVTGGAGFLGSHLCEKLLQAGHEVISADNYFTGRKSNIAYLLNNPNFEAMRHDITFPLYVEVNEIYNFACPASPIHYQFDPMQTTKTSVHGSINMLGLAKRAKARIVQASTSEVYGDPKRRRPDITLAKEDLNWQPEVSLEEGLNETIACFETLLSQQVPVIKSAKPVRSIKSVSTSGKAGLQSAEGSQKS
jgi:nucleoside-diphosphate-sugar epimerase